MGEGGKGLAGTGRAGRDGDRRREERVVEFADHLEMKGGSDMVGVTVAGVTGGARGNLSGEPPARKQCQFWGRDSLLLGALMDAPRTV